MSVHRRVLRTLLVLAVALPGASNSGLAGSSGLAQKSATRSTVGIQKEKIREAIHSRTAFACDRGPMPPG